MTNEPFGISCKHGMLARSCEVCELQAEIDRLKAQVARDDEHYKAASEYGEKYRRNWVEACQERESLRRGLEEARQDAARWRALVWYSVMQEGAAEVKYWRAQHRRRSDDVGKDMDEWAQLGDRNG